MRFLGNLNPLMIMVVSILLGFILLSYLLARTSFKIYNKQSRASYLIIAGIALLFGIEVIVADMWLVDYPENINILLPESLLFYPSIGYIVEIFFHLLPISLVVLLLSSLKRLHINSIVWISIFGVALMEPLYQVWFTSDSSLITSIYTAVHVFLFSLTQLIIFKRFDFVSMYMFRIVFYLIWHILWGELRIEYLF